MSPKEKKEELIKTIEELGRLPKSASNNNGVSERVYRDGTAQRNYFDRLQQKYKKIDKNKVLNEDDREVVEDYEEIRETLNRITVIRQQELVSLCNSYGIDTDKNKSILKKSYDEVYVKICYLNDNNLSIVKDEEVHEIFFMSDINMQAKYNVSIDSLINQYINENSRGIK